MLIAGRQVVVMLAALLFSLAYLWTLPILSWVLSDDTFTIKTLFHHYCRKFTSTGLSRSATKSTLWNCINYHHPKCLQVKCRSMFCHCQMLLGSVQCRGYRFCSMSLCFSLLLLCSLACLVCVSCLNALLLRVTGLARCSSGLLSSLVYNLLAVIQPLLPKYTKLLHQKIRSVNVNR